MPLHNPRAGATVPTSLDKSFFSLAVLISKTNSHLILVTETLLRWVLVEVEAELLSTDRDEVNKFEVKIAADAVVDGVVDAVEAIVDVIMEPNPV